MYCSGGQNAILTGMSFDVSNPDIDPPEYARANRIFFMFLNVRTDNQRNWISNKFNALREHSYMTSDVFCEFLTYLPTPELSLAGVLGVL